MFFQQYPPGQFPPEKLNNTWYIHCESGALEVLRKREYLNLNKPFYLISCIDGAFLSIKQGDALWEELKRIAGTYKVEVFPLSYTGPYEYKEWTGEQNDCQKFDVIAISVKTH